MADKVKTVAEVVRTIPDGSHIALGGFAINRCNIVVAHELIRQGKKNLTLSQGVVGLDTDLLVGAGLVSRLIMGGGSRSEEHTSELQSLAYLVCRLLLEKKKTTTDSYPNCK